MANGTLAQRITDAYLPYVQAFCRQPSRASLAVVLTPGTVEADLTLQKDDFVSIAGTSATRAEQRRTFNNLARTLTNGQIPSLAFIDGGP